ncbi:MAG TPA: YitT family protein [Anaerolineae bacterium]|nr:YitT family protein [Anaerolineae bacterium]
MKTITWRKVFSTVFDYAQLTVGAGLIALGIDLFLVPNKIVSGGLTGIATILHLTLGSPVGVVVLVLNIPLFIAGARWTGGLRFAMRTIYATAMMSILTDTLATIVATIPPITQPLLFTLYGGLLDGVGMGLVFRAQGTTGGTDIIARLANHFRGVPLGQTMLAVNGLVLVTAAIVFGVEPALYALIVTFVATRVVDIVQGEAAYARAAIIISAKADDIRSRVLADLERGVTILAGRGGYSEEGQEVLYCVVTRAEVSILKRLVQTIDPKAFVVITEASEVLGVGFKELRAS